MAEPSDALARCRPRGYGRWRAATLAAVYILITIHIVHWKLAGRTLAPLELHEVMYTLELGIVTAGFLFMALAVLSAAVFGRFFCSWGCHILALEDLSAWILAKLHIRPRPVRLRLLRLVPFAVLFYMFVWPQITRVMAGKPFPGFRIYTDAQGWGSFTTTDFWRNLPGPWIIALTFVTCGFVVVYLLGTRGFCSYVCPYGAVFGLMDRVAPGRIARTGDCIQCGRCTEACQSHVRVHEELEAHGIVVSPSCMKDLDCVTACERGAVGFRFTRPSLFRSWSRAVRGLPYDLTVAEELLLLGVFAGSILAFRGLYGAVPFLMTLGIGVVLGYLAVVAVRLARAATVHVSHLDLKIDGRWTRAGAAFVGVLLFTGAFTAHSAFIRYHEFLGHRAFERADRAGMNAGDEGVRAEVARATRHLETARRWGLVPVPEVDRRLALLHEAGPSPEKAEPDLRRLLRRDPGDLDARLALGKLLVRVGRREEGMAELARVARAARAGGGGASTRADAHLALAKILASAGDVEAADGHLAEAVGLEPDSAFLRFNRAEYLAATGRDQEAIAEYRAGLRINPGVAEAHNSLGFLLGRRGAMEEALRECRRALELDQDLAPAHYNLGRFLQGMGRGDEARAHLRRAAELDPSLGAPPGEK